MMSNPPARSSVFALGCKLLISLWIVYHLAGLVIAPASVPPSSDLARDSWLAVGHYLEAFFLNHGFHFFAPNPGPSTLVRYEVHLPDGKVQKGTLPDKTTMQPRLLYHRYFMLTEFLNAEETSESAVIRLHQRAIARTLCQKYGGDSVTLKRVVHELPEAEWVRSGMPLDHPSLYKEESLGRFVLSDL